MICILSLSRTKTGLHRVRLRRGFNIGSFCSDFVYVFLRLKSSCLKVLRFIRVVISAFVVIKVFRTLRIVYLALKLG